jgi:uncharacterized membrane protein
MSLFSDSRRLSGWTERRIIGHFLTRGALLILLQLTFINFFWRAGPFGFPPIYIGVLIALGGCMILCSFLLRLRVPYLILLAMVFFIGTELLHPDPALWNLLETDPFNLILLRSGGTAGFWSNYPILTWIEMVLFGMAFGQWLKFDRKYAYRRAAMLGLAFLTAFVILRMLDGFGNIRPRPGDGWMDLLSLVKYPPSMTFTLFTTGINLLLLWTFSRFSPSALKIIRPLAVLGAEPLFFYILHLPLYLLLGRWLTPGGSSLGIMYLIWLFGLACLYPLTLRYRRLKQRQSPDSLLRLV